MKTILLTLNIQNPSITTDKCQPFDDFAGNGFNKNYLVAKFRRRSRLPLLYLIFLVGFILVFNFPGLAQTVVTNPTSPWTVPTGVSSVKVEVWGGGGGGGGAQSNFGASYGSGGGGGAYNVNTLTVSPGQTYTITLGAGGTAGNDANGGSGTASSFSGPGGTVTAAFGTGGGRRGGAAGVGGAGFNNGGAGGLATSAGAGGGGGAGNDAPTGAGNGGNGSNSAAGSAGTGSLPGGIGGAITNSQGAGKIGTAPGGGGGGGYQNFFSSQPGGVGGAGQVVLTYTVCIPPAAPSVTSPLSYCQNTTTSSLTAVGTDLLWYNLPTGGTGSSIAPIPSTTSVGSTSYYVSQTIGCESPRSTIVVNVSELPIATVTGQSDVTCFSGNDGSITIGASQGSPQYSYSVDGGTTYTDPESNPYIFGGLKANTAYRVRVKDSKGCLSK